MESSSAAGSGEPAILASGMLPLESDDPASIGDHRLVARLGSGGMGVVYLGRDPTGRLVAVKTARPEDAEDDHLRRRFQSEADCARRVPPGWTARLLVDGTAETPPYLITEYVEGPSLAHIVDTNGPLPPEQLRALAIGVARALAAIHEADLIHRDLKPANVLLTPTGPRVIDFGIAQHLPVPASGGLTRDGVVMGSPGWIPPERLSGRPATQASDIFGWGSLVAYAATGRNPFGQGDSDGLAQRIIHEPPELEGLGEPLREPAAAALAKNPADRPSAGEILARLGAEPVVHVDTRHPRRPAAPGLAAAAVAVAVVVAAVVAAVVTSGDDRDDTRPPPGPRTATPSKTAASSARPSGHAPSPGAPAGAAPRRSHRATPPRKRTRASTSASRPPVTVVKTEHGSGKRHGGTGNSWNGYGGYGGGYNGR